MGHGGIVGVASDYGVAVVETGGKAVNVEPLRRKDDIETCGRSVDIAHLREIVDVIGRTAAELTCRVACIIDRVGRHRWTGEIGEFVNLAMGRCEGDSADENESEGEDTTAHGHSPMEG